MNSLRGLKMHGIVVESYHLLVGLIAVGGICFATICSAQYSITQNVIVGNITNTIIVGPRTNSFGDQGVSGNFMTATGTLMQFEQQLNQDHVNWFQKVLSINNY